MDYYIGCKQVQAEPQERDGAPGYKVVYPDGYTSWSPKDVFERAYLHQGADPTRITGDMVERFIFGYETQRMANHTVLCTRFRNRFSVVTESACVDPANYDETIGSALALKKARDQAWHLLGFLLATARNGV